MDFCTRDVVFIVGEGEEAAGREAIGPMSRHSRLTLNISGFPSAAGKWLTSTFLEMSPSCTRRARAELETPTQSGFAINYRHPWFGKTGDGFRGFTTVPSREVVTAHATIG